MAGRVVDVASLEELAATLAGLRLRGTQAGDALILIGGADFTEPSELASIRSLFHRLAAHCERTSTAVVDGGTDSGVMRLIAEAREAADGTFPLVGVAPRGAFYRQTRTGESISPAMGHTLIITVPGDRFGDESDWLFAAADLLHGGVAPSLLVNGGELAREEARTRLDEGAVVVAVEGSGRAADELVGMLAGDDGLRRSGRLRTIPIGVDEAGLAAALQEVEA